MSETFLERLARGALLLDGGLGTSLMASGSLAVERLALAALEAPGLLRDAHASFLSAGSEALLTGTFGASRPALARVGAERRFEELNRAAVALGRQALTQRPGGFLLGDLGPIGLWAGELADAPGLAAAYGEQARLLAEAGVDALWIETLPGAAEAVLALAAARAVTDLPIGVSLTFRRAGAGFTTLRGEPLDAALRQVAAAGPDALGLNCGEGSAALLEAFAACAAGLPLPLIAKPNAGAPLPGPDGARYAQAPADFARDLVRAVELGAAAVGGCCGADARFIAALSERLAAR